MRGAVKRAIWAALIVILVAAVTAVLISRRHTKPIVLVGAVMRQSADARKQSPINGVTVIVQWGTKTIAATSDFSGLFRLVLPREIRHGAHITLLFQHPKYAPLSLPEVVSDQLYIVRLMPLVPDTSDHPDSPPPASLVNNIVIRYSIEATTSLNVGSGAKAFQIQSQGNVPCNGHPPCSPDGRWKATIGSASLDAGEHNVYEDARLICIAGPCPFTRIVSDHFSAGGRTISASVLGWSDATTFLLQAEVFRQQITSLVREAYPVIFGREMNFSLPPAAEGPRLEAEINGTSIIFPLGPVPILRWATCEVSVRKDRARSYRCELTSGYRFQ